MASSHRLIVFTKAPRHGRVKTRMHPRLTPARSATLHYELLLHTLWQCRGADGTTALWSPPGNDSRALDRLARRFGLDRGLQRGRDLGQRMRHALDHTVTRHRQPALLIGSDCPFITPGYLTRARQALQDKPVVLGPARDGGFVLIGTRRPLPNRCFDGIEWGSGRVLEQTLAQMKRAGAACALLPALDDIDRPDDLALLPPGLHRMRWLFGCQ